MNATLRQSSVNLPHHVTMFADLLDDQLVAMARYWDNLPGQPNSPQSKMSYAAVVRPHTPLSQLRSAFGRGVGTLPMVVDDDLYPFAQQLAPVTAARLHRGEWWGGDPAPFEADAPLLAQVSNMARRLMRVSVLLASIDLTDSERVSAEADLHDLATLFDIDTALPIALQIAGCYATLEALIEDVPGFSAPELPAVRDETIACIPGVRAIYEEIDNAIFAVESGESLVEVDWEIVKENFADNFGRIHLTTTTLLPILVQHDLAVAFAIDRYRIHWGQDIAYAVQASKEQLVSNAAQTVFALYAETLPQGYIYAQDDESLGAHIHDLQNDLLKVQLQHELLTMLCNIPVLDTPRLDIDPQLPRETRIGLLREHLREWLCFYKQLLDLVTPISFAAAA